ncbi:MAG: biotin--[acetyl-CoA-carboxylase] ligase [Calditerrivibrio sp.]|nr:biotin--[acetyl-CoA-carboxylase] ligase [Calditerrivibrio sp.]
MYFELPRCNLFKRLFLFDEIDSTNSEALGGNYPFYSVILAKKQRRGKGRSGRVWLSQEDNLFFSLVLPPLEIENLLPLNIVSGYSVCEALRGYCEAFLKWPNDIVINGKKVGGILIETKFSGNNLEKVVVGIGVNVNQRYFPDELSNLATSLYLSKGTVYNLDEVFGSILLSFESFYDQLIKNSIDIIEKWCKYSYCVGKKIRIHYGGEKKEFTEIGINRAGELFVIDEAGEKKYLLFGDVYL